METIKRKTAPCTEQLVNETLRKILQLILEYHRRDIFLVLGTNDKQLHITHIWFTSRTIINRESEKLPDQFEQNWRIKTNIIFSIIIWMFTQNKTNNLFCDIWDSQSGITPQVCSYFVHRFFSKRRDKNWIISCLTTSLRSLPSEMEFWTKHHIDIIFFQITIWTVTLFYL